MWFYKRRVNNVVKIFRAKWLLNFILSRRRNCKGNPYCISSLGERDWLREIEDSAWHDITDPVLERRKKVWASAHHLSSFCVPTCLWLSVYQLTRTLPLPSRPPWWPGVHCCIAERGKAIVNLVLHICKVIMITIMMLIFLFFVLFSCSQVSTMMLPLLNIGQELSESILLSEIASCNRRE